MGDVDLDQWFRKKKYGYMSAYRKRKAEKRRAEGKCVKCGVLLSDEEVRQYKTCETCREKIKEASRRARAKAKAEGRSLYTDVTRARANAYSARRRAECKQKGICTRCCHEPAREGMSTCKVCADKQLAYQRGYFAKMKARGY